MKQQLLLLLLWFLPCVGNAQGIITTVAGTGTYGCSGNGGPATAAQFFAPGSLVFDEAGSYYFADSGVTIRKVDRHGVVWIFAGRCDTGGKYVFDSPDGVPATSVKFLGAEFITRDEYKNIYISGGGRLEDRFQRYCNTFCWWHRF